MKDYIIYHAHCNDGKMAAAVMFKHLAEWSNNEVTVIDCNYSDPVPLLDKDADSVYVVDFSFHGEALVHLSKMAKRIVILDHHKGAEEKMRDTIAEHELRNVELIFDNSKSGALLTWEYCSDAEPASIVKDVSDRDLWKFERPNSKATHLGLAGLSWRDIVQSNLFTEEGYTQLIENSGRPRLEFSDKMNKTVAQTVGSVQLLNKEIYVLNCHMQQCSDTAHLVIDAPDAQFDTIMVYQIFDDQMEAKISFRSNDGMSARMYANHFGGGGHADAAGAKCSIETLMLILTGKYCG